MDHETLNNESSRALQPLQQPGHLPSEVLAEIFILILPPQSWPQARQLKVLSLVCRFWHLIVDSTPALWSRITITDNIPHVRKALLKSGGHPIDVRGESSLPAADWRGWGDEPSSFWFLTEVRRHAQRWRHVALEVPPPDEFAPTFDTLPLLQTLDLCSWDNSVLSDQLLALMNRQHVPFLRELSVRRLCIARWDLISLPPTLSKLEISDIAKNYQLIVGWLSIIPACPNLAIFRLRNTSTSPGDGVNGDENTAPVVVELNALRKLELENVHPGLVIDLLARLRLPEDCAISISCTLVSPAPSTSFLSPALSNRSNFQRAESARQVTITLSGMLRAVLVVYKQWRIDLNLAGPWEVRDALEWFGIRGEGSNASSSHRESLQAGLATSNNPPVTLKLGPNWLYRNFFNLRAVSDCRNINRIEIDSLSDEERRAFLFYLSTPEDPKKSPRTMAECLLKKPESNQEVAGVWPFPGLSELVWRERKGDVGHRVLVEPLMGQGSDDAGAGNSKKAKRSELSEPNTPWEKVV